MRSSWVWRRSSSGTGEDRYGNTNCLHVNGTDAHGDIPPEFWEHVAVVLGVPVPEKSPDLFFVFLLTSQINQKETRKMTDIEKWKEILTSYGVKTEESKYDAHVDEFNRVRFYLGRRYSVIPITRRKIRFIL